MAFKEPSRWPGQRDFDVANSIASTANSLAVNGFEAVAKIKVCDMGKTPLALIGEQMTRLKRRGKAKPNSSGVVVHSAVE